MTEPDNEWYYVVGSAQHGPLPRAELERAYAAGVIGPDTRVWRPGLTVWTPYRALFDVGAALPPPLPPEAPAAERDRAADAPHDPYAPPREAVQEAPLVQPRLGGPQRPGLRVAARVFDVMLFLLAFGLLIGIVAGATGNVEIMLRMQRMSTLEQMLLQFGFVLGGCVASAVSLALFRTTPGKALFGMRVVPVDGGAPTLVTFLLRELQVFVLGLGLGVPLLAVIGGLAAIGRLAREGATSWDARLGLTVDYVELTPLRRFVAGGLTMLLVLLFVASGLRGMH